MGVRPPLPAPQDSKGFIGKMASRNREAIFVGGCFGGCWFSRVTVLLLGEWLSSVLAVIGYLLMPSSVAVATLLVQFDNSGAHW